MVSAWAEPRRTSVSPTPSVSATINLLRDAAAEGRLGFEELADRIDVAVHARTRAELEPLTRRSAGSRRHHQRP